MKILPRFSLEGKVAIVTGGSKGIGRATALGLAEAGADVAVASRKLQDLEKAADEIRALGRRALPVSAHVGRLADIHELVEKVKATFGRIDILVNNAGTNPAYTTILDSQERLWDSIMNLNLKGPYFLIQEVARVMKEHGGGSIINVSSVDGFRPHDQLGIYSISKAGLNMLTRSAALELAPYRIRVNGIAPGAVQTRILDAMFAHLSQEDAKKEKERMAAHYPLRRIADPEDMVGAMVYLASDASSFTTGEVIAVDGGALLT